MNNSPFKVSFNVLITSCFKLFKLLKNSILKPKKQNLRDCTQRKSEEIGAGMKFLVKREFR